MRNLYCSLMALGILAFTNTYAQTDFNPGILARKSQTSLDKKVQQRISEIANTEGEAFINEMQYLIESQTPTIAKQMIDQIAAIEVDNLVAKYADIIQTSYKLTESERDEAAILLKSEMSMVINQTLDILLAPSKAKTEKIKTVSEAERYQVIIAALVSDRKAKREGDNILMTMLLAGIFEHGLELSVKLFPQIIDKTAYLSAGDYVLRLNGMGLTDQQLAGLQKEIQKALVRDITKHCQNVLEKVMKNHGMKHLSEPLQEYFEKKYPGALKELEAKMKSNLDKKSEPPIPIPNRQKQA